MNPMVRPKRSACGPNSVCRSFEDDEDLRASTAMGLIEEAQRASSPQVRTRVEFGPNL